MRGPAWAGVSARSLLFAVCFLLLLLLDSRKEATQVLGDVPSCQAEREQGREHPPLDPAQVAHGEDLDASASAFEWGRRNSQVLPGLKMFESITRPSSAPGSDQSYRRRSHTNPIGHGLPSVTSAHVSPLS